MPKLSKREYQLAFIDLTSSFVSDDITTNEYKESLHTLIDNYRKDYPYGKTSQTL